MRVCRFSRWASSIPSERRRRRTRSRSSGGAFGPRQILSKLSSRISRSLAKRSTSGMAQKLNVSLSRSPRPSWSSSCNPSTRSTFPANGASRSEISSNG
ncbi:hypothetical protein IEO21_07759 [Rhodonia placenta]|uniref:Uncharacterized protein n=1 Tax=Rhodonia placenta TaxID=104341 RepID=A0A8H7NXR2_9APHY|nr:hypothetical protein IEO21_07759 [Postia placenta]